MSNFTDPKIQYFEMIQNIISRMAKNSFSLKGWAITLVTGVFALVDKDANWSYFLISYIPILLFWFLDAYYLQKERKFRVLYNSQIHNKKLEPNFDLSPPKSNWKEKTYYIQSLMSLTESLFYLSLAIISTILIFIIQKRTM